MQDQSRTGFLKSSLLCLSLAVLISPHSFANAARVQTPKAMLRIPDGQQLLFSVHAKGVQIYEGKASAADASKLEWTLKDPEAVLFDGAGRKVGKHYAGPTWESVDGSKVVGKRLNAVDANQAGDIPWLLLKADTTSGVGMMNGVSYILRVDTHDGAAPAKAPRSLGEMARVKYKATYIFLTLAAGAAAP